MTKQQKIEALEAHCRNQRALVGRMEAALRTANKYLDLHLSKFEAGSEERGHLAFSFTYTRDVLDDVDAYHKGKFEA